MKPAGVPTDGDEGPRLGCGPLIPPLLDTLRPLRQQVFERVRAAGQIARVQLAKDLGVSPASVTTATSELIETGLIEEVASPRDGDSGRGRPAVALGVRAERLSGRRDEAVRPRAHRGDRRFRRQPDRRQFARPPPRRDGPGDPARCLRDPARPHLRQGRDRPRRSQRGRPRRARLRRLRRRQGAVVAGPDPAQRAAGAGDLGAARPAGPYRQRRQSGHAGRTVVRRRARRSAISPW